MTQGKRIILNTLASYGRSLITFPINLCATRWVLGALGQEDFGLYSVVGGIVFFVTFISAVLSGAVSRFYAYSIGSGRNVAEEIALKDLGMWFNTSLSLFVLLPIFFLLIGLPVGDFAVRHWLSVPPARIDAVIWVLRFSLMTSVLSVVVTPYSAFFTAYQNIVELTLYTLLASVLTFGFALCLFYVPGDRLIVYSAGMMFIQLFIGVLTIIRGRVLFDAARIDSSFMFNWRRIWKLASFTGWKILSGFGYLVRGQGSALLINISFGPSANAAYSVANQIAGQTAAFSQHMVNAFSPAVTTAEGAGERKAMLDLVYRSCKFSSVLVLLFAAPLCLEIDGVLRLWLKRPPLDADFLCVCVVIMFLIEKLVIGQNLAITAQGDVKRSQIWESVAFCATFVIGIITVSLGFDVRGIGVSIVISTMMVAAVRVYFAWKQVGMSPWYWLYYVVLKVMLAAMVTIIAGCLVIKLMPESLCRVIITSVSCGIALFAISWLVVFTKDEKSYITERVHLYMRRVRR